MITIPKEVAALENVRSGEMVKIEIKKVPLDLCGAFPSITSFNKEDKIDIKWRKFKHG